MCTLHKNGHMMNFNCTGCHCTCTARKGVCKVRNTNVYNSTWDIAMKLLLHHPTLLFGYSFWGGGGGYSYMKDFGSSLMRQLEAIWVAKLKWWYN